MGSSARNRAVFTGARATFTLRHFHPLLNFRLVPTEVCGMSQEVQQTEYAYFVRIETSTKSTDIPVAFLTRQQLANFLQFDFKRLVEEAGIKGARIHVERATTADYEKVLGDIAACLRTAGIKAA